MFSFRLCVIAAAEERRPGEAGARQSVFAVFAKHVQAALKGSKR